MASLTKSIEVNVPVRTAYNQWTQFESFPQFMEGVKSVQQMDNKRLQNRKKWERLCSMGNELGVLRPVFFHSVTFVC